MTRLLKNATGFTGRKVPAGLSGLHWPGRPGGPREPCGEEGRRGRGRADQRKLETEVGLGSLLAIFLGL